MGFGGYSHAAHIALTRARSTSSLERMFSATRCHPLMNPLGVGTRECRDSPDNPASLGIVFVLDVTGSMGCVPQRLATQTLPSFMQTLLDARVANPEVCFMAVGQAGVDSAPLQVGQFESTAALIDQWLTYLCLEGGGKGQHESYELALYFAARHTRLDSVEKRGRRAFMFITADVAPNPAVSRREVERIIGDRLEADLPIRDLIEEIQRSYEPFILLAPHAALTIDRGWRDLFGDRVVRLRDMEDAAFVAAGLVALLQGLALDSASLAMHFQSCGVPESQARRIAGTLVAFAASIDRDGSPEPVRGHVELPLGVGASGIVRE